MNGTQPSQTDSSMLFGEIASSGLAQGRALLCDCGTTKVVPRRKVSPEKLSDEIERFDAAVTATEKNLLDIQTTVQETLGEYTARIFEAQILLLRDVQLRDTVRETCLREQINAEAALEEAVKQLMALFRELDDPYFRERAADLPDVEKRLLAHLSKETQVDLPAFPQGSIIVTSELLSSVVIQLEGCGVAGLIVENGTLTAHATILARALNIPMLVRIPGAARRIRTGDELILDALSGRAFINPKIEVRKEYERLEIELQAHLSSLKNLIKLPATTRDGTSIELRANIGQSAESVAAARINADGCGLYRTEFGFLVQNHFPSEEEQFHFYRETAEHIHPKETVFRVLDIGSDKTLPYFPLKTEANPALGRRGLRLLLHTPKVLHTQLRAILRLSATHNVSLLLPMVSGLEDVRAARAAIETAQAELTAENHSFNPALRVGVMVETPAAVFLLPLLAEEVDFFNVGSNDLVQYLLAADRTSDESDSPYDPLHPAVLQVLARLVIDARSKEKPLCLCGEIASDPRYTALLIGLGFRSFSVNPSQFLEVKEVIRSSSLAGSEALAQKALTLRTAQETHLCVQTDWARRNPISSVLNLDL